MPPAMKRKRDALEADDDADPRCSLDARKSILDISMFKLRSSPPRKVEPSLRRSVLIFNTLKHIEAQLKEEGVNVAVPGQTAGQPMLVPVIEDTSDAVVEVAPPSVCGGAHCCSPGGHGIPGCDAGGEGVCQCLGYKQNDAYLGQSTTQHRNTGRLPCGMYSDPTGNIPPPAQLPTNSIGLQHQQQSCYHDNTIASTTSMATATSLASPMFTSSPSMNQSNPVYSSHHHSGASSCSMSMSVTETLFSDTSKMLDTLLNSDRLVAVASFTSLFDLDNVDTGSNITNSDTNLFNVPVGSNSMSAHQSPQWGSQECAQISVHTSEWSSTELQSSSSIVSMSTDSTTSTYQELHSPASVQSSAGAFTNAASSSTVTTTSASQLAASSSQSPPISSSISVSCINSSPSANQITSPAANHNMSPPSSPLTCRQECDAANSSALSSLGDIDCNMFDFDLFMPSLSPSGKLTPLNHDDLAHSLPSTESPFSAPAWTPKSEHITDDLDHIMQILVGL